jgi:two-component system nitrate/nitrite response regulator NarL
MLIASTALDRQAFARLLRHDLGLDPIAEAALAPVSIWEALRRQPNLVLLLADRATIEACDAIDMIRRLARETPIVVVSAALDPQTIKRWAGLAIKAYVIKDGGVDELRAAVQAVAGGNSYYSAGVRAMLRAEGEASNGLAKLSRREAELLPLLARGMTLREAASAMTVSYKTADSYRTSLLRKLGLRDRVELARYAIRENIIDA